MDKKKSEEQTFHKSYSEDKKIYRTKNIYLAAFLISQEKITLGKIYMDQPKADGKAWVEVEYAEEISDLLRNYVDVYDKKKAICRLHTYQENIRFIMYIVNTRKSGIEDDTDNVYIKGRKDLEDKTRSNHP